LGGFGDESGSLLRDIELGSFKGCDERWNFEQRTINPASDVSSANAGSTDSCPRPGIRAGVGD
jgi:hypothetical protein